MRTSQYQLIFNADGSANIVDDENIIKATCNSQISCFNFFHDEFRTMKMSATTMLELITQAATRLPMLTEATLKTHPTKDVFRKQTDGAHEIYNNVQSLRIWSEIEKEYEGVTDIYICNKCGHHGTIFAEGWRIADFIGSIQGYQAIGQALSRNEINEAQASSMKARLVASGMPEQLTLKETWKGDLLKSLGETFHRE